MTVQVSIRGQLCLEKFQDFTHLFAICDRHWRLRHFHVNQEITNQLPNLQTRVIGKVIWQLFPLLSETRIEQELQRVLTEHISVDLKAYLECFQAEVEIRAYPVDEGLACYAQKISTPDIHDSFPAQIPPLTNQSVSTFSGLLEGLLFASPVAICLLDANLYYLMVNPRMAEINGLSIAAHLGRRFRDVLPEMAAFVEPTLQQVLDTGRAKLNVEISGMTREENCYFGHWLGSYYPVRDAQDKVIGLGVILAEITAIKQAESDAQTTKQQIINILESISDAFVALDHQWRYTYVNEEAAQVLKIPKQQLIGNVIWDIFPDLIGTNTEDNLRKSLAEQIPMEFEAYYAPLESWSEIHVYPSLEGISIYFREITERKKAEQERVRLLAELALKQYLLEEDIKAIALAREAQRQSEERFQVMFNQAAVGMILATLEGRFLMVNPAFCEIVGYSQAELIEKRFQELTYPEDLENDLSFIDQVLAKEIKGYSLEKRYIRKDESLVWVNLTASVVWNSEGQAIYRVGIVENIDRQKAIAAERDRLLEQEQLARARAEAVERQLARIFETSPIGIGLLDRQQRYIAINEALAEINGLKQEEHLGKRIQELFAEIDPEVIKVIEEIYQTGETFISPNFPVNTPGRSDRRPGYYNVYCLPIKDATDQVESLLIYVVDVTERYYWEQTQEFLARSSRVLASSLDSQTILTQIAELAVPRLADWCTVHLVDEAGITHPLAVTHINPDKVAWAQELSKRYPYDPNIPRGVPEVIRTGQSELYPEIPDQLLVESARDDEHLEMLREAGFTSVMIVPLPGRERPLGAISLVSAESGRQYRQVDLEFAQEWARRAALAVENARLYTIAQRDRTKAEAANQIKDEFLAVLSHELRSPLNPILGWTQLLRTRNLNEATRTQALEVIERNVKLQTQLIDDLLDVSRILRGKLVLNLVPTDLKTIIEAALDTVQLSAQAKQITIHSDLSATVSCVAGDSGRLQQVVWNLLSNAIKFTPPQGQITIDLQEIPAQPHPYVQIQIQDTGIGISREFLPFVFESFRQADGKTTRQFGGLGLGLAIVRHLVELQGGTVTADSPGEDQGATFTVRLPAIASQNSIAKGHSVPESITNLQGLTILVVDDEADMRQLAKFILEQQGAQVDTAASAAEALSLLGEKPFSVLISDIGMPEMDGYMLIKQIRANSTAPAGKILAIALTAYAGETNLQQALNAGFQIHLSKPIEPHLLVKAIASLCQQP